VHYIFEDHPSNMLATLFREGYSVEVAHNFHYTKGNGKIFSYIQKHFKEEEDIIVFLDMPPGNSGVVDVYDSLLSLSRTYTSLVIIPIICMEYYLLLSVRKSHLVTVSNWVDTCLQFGYAGDTSPNILVGEDPQKNLTFEKFCKLVTRKALAQCLRVGTLSQSEDRYRPYYYEDCICGTQHVTHNCLQCTRKDKARALISALPIRPAYRDGTPEEIVAKQNYLLKQKELVEEYNKRAADTYNRTPNPLSVFAQIDAQLNTTK